MDRYCVTCQFFRDAEYDKTYKTPRCTVQGDDDCTFMRKYICGIDGTLYEAKNPPAQPPARHLPSA